MQFGRSKAGRLSREGRRRLRKSGKRGAIALGTEWLEPRRLLAAGNINSAPPFSVAEQVLFTNQLVATINDPTATVNDYAATINWGDGTTTSGQVQSTSQTGIFNVVGSHAYNDEGTEIVRVTVSKDGVAAAPVSEPATITDPPISGTGGFTFNATEGATPPTQLLATFTDPAPEGTAAYAASIDWGDGSISAGTISYNAGLSAFQVTGGSDHVYTTSGAQAIKVTITHKSTPPITVTDLASVAGVAVSAQGGYTYTANEGASPTLQTLATFTDSGGNAPLSDYSATIDWGDGNITAGSISLVGGQFSVLGAHTYAEEGRGVIQVTINHDGFSSPVASSYNISDPAVLLTPMILTATEGTALNAVTVATFVDPGGPEDTGDYTAQINWGDNTTSAGTVTFNAQSSVFSVIGSHNYQSPGAMLVTVTVSHDVAPGATTTATANVSDIPVAGTAGPTFTAVEGSTPAAQVLATFTDPGVVAALSEYQATINWGDGTTADQGTIRFNNATQIFTVTAQHLYAEEGTYPITIILGHDLANSVTVTGTASVADPAVNAVGGASFNAVEYRQSDLQVLAAFTDPGGAEPLADYSATVNWGDGTSSSGQIASNGTNNFGVYGAHLYTTFGTHTTTVTINHDHAPAATVQDTAVVTLPPIRLSALPATWREWTVPVELSPLATLSFTDTEMTATIGWGDGATTLGVITPDLLGSSGTVRGHHMYTEAGNYTITITVNDGPAGTPGTTLAIPTTVLRELLPIPDPNSGTPNQYYVAEVYGDILRRAVDGGGLRAWTSALDAGVPRIAVADALLDSPEYLGHFVIGPAYAKYLGRAADPNGLQFWISQMQHGVTDATLAALFASSPEFFANAGGTNDGYVTALYQNVLGRNPDPGGKAFWLAQLNAGASRYSVALQFVNSGEDFTKTVFSDYESLLDRVPTPAEQSSAVIGLTQGTLTDEGLLASIVATDEYFALSQNE